MFLPITREEMIEKGWNQVDFVLVTGDAYVDHHSFGTAIIGRLLESRGYKVAVLPQPDYKSIDDFQKAVLKFNVDFLTQNKGNLKI